MSDQQPPSEPPIDPSGAGGAPVPTDPNASAAALPWYKSRAALVAAILFALLAIILLIGWLFWWSDDETIESGEIVDSSTVPMASTIPDGSIVDGTPVPTIEVTLPPDTTAPPTTAPATTAPATTAPPTTAPATTAPATTAPATTVPISSMMDALAANPDLSRFHDLIVTAGQEAYVETNPLSLFAPNNDAIAAYETANGPIDTDEKVVALLEGHGVEELVDETALVGPSEFHTTSGFKWLVENMVVTVDGVDPPLEGNVTVTGDDAVVNGFLYVVDTVLTPPAP